jgi:branched-chain amino acid transport system permease protein
MKSVNIGLRRDAFLIAGLAAVLIVAELVITSQFHRSILTLSVIYSIAAIGLTLLLGYAGQVSIGQGAFMGLGAYAAAFCIQKIGLPVPLTIIVATLLSATFGYFLARPILRLSGHNLALATLALGAVFFVFASQWREVTGGLDPGIVDLPSLEVGGFTHARVVFWLAATLLVVCAALAVTIVGGRFGRALKTLRTSEVVASCMGIDVARTKAAVFAIAAGFAGLSGSLFALYLRSFNAGAFGVGLSIELLMMVIIGSLSTIWGAIFGAFAIVLLPNLLEGFDHAKLLIYGLTMVGIMMFAPNGLGEAIARLLLRRRRSA